MSASFSPLVWPYVPHNTKLFVPVNLNLLNLPLLVRSRTIGETPEGVGKDTGRRSIGVMHIHMGVKYGGVSSR